MNELARQPPASATPVIDAEGHFHATDAPIDLGHYLAEDWLALALFWLLGLCVFYQFFTRYVLNDSAAWTEEIARYLLVAITFVAISSATRRTRHIHVDFLFRLIPKLAGRTLSTVIDIIRIAFFAIAVYLTYEMMGRMSYYKMTVVDLPVNLVYGFCLLGFAAATIRSVQVAIENWRRGWSLLERPEHAIEETV
ncbi:MAG TPA: TRAP transporter small permease [Casimicrobiaceae bacterium]|nr:TRAP transporter small permease [Casimicrobiaceae bacterium]